MATLRNYLRYHDIPLRMHFVVVPSATMMEENHKYRWSIEQIRDFVNAAINYCDKAIVLCLFQSGLA